MLSVVMVHPKHGQPQKLGVHFSVSRASNLFFACPFSSFYSHGVLFLSVALSVRPSLIARSPGWLRSSIQTRGQHSVASNLPQLHVASYCWVLLSVASSPREAYGLLMRLNGDDLYLVNCGLSGQRGAIFCWLWCEREAGNQRCVGLQY